jgi:hypothetical protein
MTGQATDVANDPLNATDPTGMCRGGDPDGKCEFATSVSDSKNAGAVAAAKEKGDAALQRIDKSIQGLGDDTTYKYQSTEGTTISQTGAEIKTQWNDQSFTMTDQSDFGNSGGGTAAYGNIVMNAENFSGWEALGQGEFILLHDGMAHTSRVGQGVLRPRYSNTIKMSPLGGPVVDFMIKPPKEASLAHTQDSMRPTPTHMRGDSCL